MYRSLAICLVTAGMLGPVRDAIAEDGLCGARCVHRVLERLNKQVDLTAVIEELYDSPSGGTVSIQELARVLGQHGISCRVVRLGPLDVPSSPQPIILHLNGNHFVVLEQSERHDHLSQAAAM